MLLVHQAGSVKVGEVVRYTLTYTPSQDRILPSPKHLHLKIKNTSAIPLRAAYLHGPYTLHVSAYPSTFNPNKKVEDPKKYGVPEFEPLLKAGGSWTSELTVPEHIRETGATFASGRRSQDLRKSEDKHGRDKEQEERQSVTWVIEVASQILFSNSAEVHFEVLVGRDERSLELGFAAVAGHGHGAPGQVGDHKVREKKTHGQHSLPQKGVYSKAVKLVVEDTETLWDKPSLPKIDNAKDEEHRHNKHSQDGETEEKDRKEEKPLKKKKIHLVVLTHGLHSNIGADMLYLKESIDATVKQARLDARKRRAAYKAQQRDKHNPNQSTADQPAEQTSDDKTSDNPEATTAPLTGGQEELQDNDDDGSDDEEQTIVRGFTGNAVRTERGIQYLGKRLAKYVLHLTYPDQPFLPVKKSMSRALTDTFKSTSTKDNRDGLPAHHGSSVHRDQDYKDSKGQLAYTFTSISFVGHSLGGLIQTYAIAYIQKHAPHFFEQIQPINFICMASPLLGLSNENPMYVKFALDFGVVGRTGQDLGLTWRAPTLAKSGWSSLVNGFTSAHDKDNEKAADPGAKPLLRILPTGPAHTVLRMFRNRTVYANVVNDGIVPLRTSCLLFLDWRGLGKVDKARRDNGLIGTMAEWGWSELTGANALSKSAKQGDDTSATENDAELDDSGTNTPTQRGQGDTVPQPSEDATTEDNKASTRSASASSEPEPQPYIANHHHATSMIRTSPNSGAGDGNAESSGSGFLGTFMNFLRPAGDKQSTRVTKAIRRGQTTSPSPSGSVSGQSGHSTTQSRTSNGEGSDTASLNRKSLISRGSTDNPTMLHPHSAATGAGGNGGNSKKRPRASRGDTIENDPLAPPRTSIFESASDILHPPIPSEQWIIDPSSRERTIFHDRVYHPEDIPPPPIRRPTLGRSFSGLGGRSFSSDSISLRSSHSKDTQHSTTAPPGASLAREGSPAPGEIGSMKVEEKIARAYHRDLSWRKVLVRLEPDAHNNMIVRRMFANAYGWPVIKHLCDTHFADTWTARMRDEDEAAFDRAKQDQVTEEGEEVQAQQAKEMPKRNESELREEKDELGALAEVGTGIDKHRFEKTDRSTREDSVESGIWDDTYFDGGSDDDDEDHAHTQNNTYGSKFQKIVGNLGLGAGGRASPSSSNPSSPKQPPAQMKSPLKNRLDHLRTTSSGSHAQPHLSSDNASGTITPSPTNSQHALSPQSSTSTVRRTGEPGVLAEPDAMTPREAIDPGNLTPGGIIATETQPAQPSLANTNNGISGGGIERMVAPPEVQWVDARRGSLGEVGLGKSVEERLSSDVGQSGRAEMVSRLSGGSKELGGS
ncbi:putative serine esterase-domain-containing protein [Delphinella strobiligena]|nr:putative serine esterase-domain-containing protein [Delphinella strobiligena]